jgi:hypothetical protein
LTVDQALHGYRDGHELLASSLAIERSARRTLLSMTDLSGPGFVDGFDGYLTGYALPELGKYAFGRTWYAKELERPGCVWTHTLLIDLADIARLESLWPLRRAFRRPKPKKGSQAPRYGSPLDVPLGTDVAKTQRPSPALAERVLSALYGLDSAPVVLPGSRAGEFDSLIFELWAQQWPRLRRAFTFCTGALGVRLIGKMPLDLQVVPVTRWARVVRGNTPVHPLELDTSAEADRSEEWAVAARVDLERGESALRRFLLRFGADAPGTRSAFRTLAKSFIALENLRRDRGTLRELVDIIGRDFSLPSDAGRLKLELLSPPAPSAQESLPASEFDRILSLLGTPYESAFAMQELRLPERTLALVRLGMEGEAALLRKLLDAPLNNNGKSLLSGALASIRPEDLEALHETDNSLFNRVVGLRPAMLAGEAVWRGSRSFQRSAVSLAGRMSLPPESVQDLIVAALSAGSRVIADEATALWGKATAHAVLAWIDGPDGEAACLDESWWGTLRSFRSETLTWLECPGRPARASTLSILPRLFEPENAELAGIHSERLGEWARAVAASQGSTETLALFLAVGLRKEDGASATVVAAAFPAVHEALLRGRLSWRAWSWLEPLMQSRDWFFSSDWDRADKLRRAFLSMAVEYDWPPASIQEAAYSEDSRRYLLQTAKRSDAWDRVVRVALESD